MSAAEELRVAWSPPGRGTPPQCLEYEVQLAEEEEEREAEAAWAVGQHAPCRGEGTGERGLMAVSRQARWEIRVCTPLRTGCRYPLQGETCTVVNHCWAAPWHVVLPNSLAAGHSVCLSHSRSQWEALSLPCSLRKLLSQNLKGCSGLFS